MDQKFVYTDILRMFEVQLQAHYAFLHSNFSIEIFSGKDLRNKKQK